MDYNFRQNNIAKLRQEQGLTQQQLAEKIKTSQANLSRWEKGLNEPSITECWKLAEFFNVTIDYLCGREKY